MRRRWQATLPQKLTCGLSGAFLEAQSGKVKFEDIKSEALAMVVKFMEYKLKLVNRQAQRAMQAQGPARRRL